MSTKSHLWLSITRNVYNANSGIPAISQGMTHWIATKPYYGSPDDITGFRGLPIELIEDIFLFAAQGSSYTRWALTRVCGSWRRVALRLRRMWVRLYIARSNTWYDQVVFSMEGYKTRYYGTMVDVHLDNPNATQLYDLVGFAPTTQWESLHLRIKCQDIDEKVVTRIFTGLEFPNLTSLHLEEVNTDLDTLEEMGQDPYTALYDAIFLTATRLQSLYINSDLKGIAPQYGLFGKAIQSLGGSSCFVGDALPHSPEAGTYSHITRITLYRWDPDMFRNLNLPSLSHLKVDHCLHDENWIRNSTDPSIILPSLLEVHLTTHSLPVLPQLCAGRLEVLMIDRDYERWDGCLSPTTLQSSTDLSTLILDVWSTASLERVQIHTPVDIQRLLTFLYNTKGLRDLTLAVPNDKQWCTDFAYGLGARWGRDRHLAHCPNLEYLTLLMDWDYREGKWVEEIRSIFDAREGAVMRSIICRWTGDARQVESGPAGDFGAFEGECYCPAGEPDIGPNLHDAKQVESRADEGACTEDEDMTSNHSTPSEDWDEDDIFGSYDDIPFP